MEAAAAVRGVAAVRAALAALAALQLTASLWPPPPAPLADGAQFDYVVVGAGSAGCVLASRLTEDPRVRVLLVEAGGDPPLESVVPSLFPFLRNSRFDWNHTAQFDKYALANGNYRRVELSHGRVLGGSSSTNYMFYVRGNPRDYDAWAAASGDPSWGWEGVLPYFIKSERLLDREVLRSSQGKYHGTSGPLGVTKQSSGDVSEYFEAFREIGYERVVDVTGDAFLGVTRPLLTIADGVRQSAAYSFLTPIRDRRNLHVLRDALVTKILFDGEKNAIGVEVDAGGGSASTVKAKREVILSAGALNSPQVLMLSGVGPAARLRRLNVPVVVDAPDVGRHLQDHAPVLVWHSMGVRRSPPPPPPPPPDATQFPFPALTAYGALDPSRNYPDFQSVSFLMPANSTDSLEMCTFAFGASDEICRRVYDETRGRDVLYSAISLLRPKSRGEVVPRGSNPRDSPLIYTESFSERSDSEEAAKFLKDFARIANSTYFRSVGARTVDPRLPQCAGLERSGSQYWRCYALHAHATMFHYSGTCALGRVVDARLRVRGVRRLRVVDASVMPAITSGNTNAPTIMIAEKAADLIKRDDSDSRYDSESLRNHLK